MVQGDITKTFSIRKSNVDTFLHKLYCRSAADISMKCNEKIKICSFFKGMFRERQVYNLVFSNLNCTVY